MRRTVSVSGSSRLLNETWSGLYRMLLAFSLICVTIVFIIYGSSQCAKPFWRSRFNSRIKLVNESIPDTFERRNIVLSQTCAKYSDPFRPESNMLGLSQPPSRLGSEVVYLRPHDKAARLSVCVPHKVGSNSWAKFTKIVEESTGVSQTLDIGQDIQSLAKHSLKAVVVRHPLERLVSVYRMIFEDWCNQDRFLAKQWDNVCKDIPPDEDVPSQSSNLLSKLLDHHLHDNDRFIRRIFEQFRPHERLVDPKRQLKFTFKEFVRFIVNASLEFDADVTGHVGLNYHWAPYWIECQGLCSSPEFQPDFILRMESLTSDLHAVLGQIGLAHLASRFPHTHDQSGGHSSLLAEKYFASLTKDEVMQLYEKYKVDHELFGYSVEPFLKMAQADK